MKLHHLTLALGLTALIGGCDQVPLAPKQDNSAAAVSDTSAVVATVNGAPITEQGLAVYQQQRHSRRPNDPTGQDREAVLEELINLELARQAGVEQGLDEKPDIALQIDQQRRAVIEASDGKVGTFIERLLVTCYTFNPTTGQYSVTAMTVMQIGGVLTLLAVAVMIFVLWRRERSKHALATT